MQQPTYRSAKQEIWEAYKNLAKQIEEQQKLEKAQKKPETQEGGQQKLEASEQQKPEEFSIERIISDISTLKTNTNNLLNRLADKLTEEAEKLNRIKNTIKDEDQNLEQVYKLRAEADTLIKLLEIQDNQKREFERRIKEQEEKLTQEIENRKKHWAQEEDEHGYTTKAKRRKDELEYQFYKEEKERELNQREKIIYDKENYLKELEEKINSFPQQLEAAIKEAQTKVKSYLEKENFIANELKGKEIEKEREILQLKIQTLEEKSQKQLEYIQNLESQLSASNQKAQELALKIIEARRESDNRIVPQNNQQKPISSAGNS